RRRRAQQPGGRRAGSAPPAGGCSGGAALPGRASRAPGYLTDSTVRKFEPPLVCARPVTVTVSAILLITSSGSAVLSLLGSSTYSLSVPFSTRPTGLPFFAQSTPHCLCPAPLAPMVA